jgi:leucine dehydrogenase
VTHEPDTVSHFVGEVVHQFTITVSVVVSSSFLDVVAEHRVEQVDVVADPSTGLKALVAVHSTALGPALGGTRYYPYQNEGDALVDVLRLSQGMTYKHALCGNNLGGGKAVILGDPATDRTDELIVAYARFLDRLSGRYLTAEDVGTTQADMDLIRTVTPYVTGCSEHLGGSGDPSPATAVGVFVAIEALARRLWGSGELTGRHIVISGVGKVGADLARRLAAAGARLTVADVAPGRAAGLAGELGATVVDPATAHTVACDVLSPCALGAVLTGHTIADLRCAAVCGSANNQLGEPADADRLADAGVVYAPDYLVNAGGVINIAEETTPGGYDRDRAHRRIEGIAATLLEVLTMADAAGITPSAAADQLAETRLAAAQPS